MKNEEHNSNFIQCQCCGYVYTIVTEKEIPADALMIRSWCPQCGSYRGLNCGKKQEDIYLFYDHTKDPRWYY